MLTGLDGSRMDAIRIGSSRSKGLDCIFYQQTPPNHWSLNQIDESRKSKCGIEREWRRNIERVCSMYVFSSNLKAND